MEFQSKQEIRELMKKIRKNISNREDKETLIFNKLINSEEFKKANTIAFYISFSDEVDTKRLIDYSLSINKTIVIPKVVDEKLEFYYFNGDYTLLAKSRFNILEPDSTACRIDDNQIDLMIIPGLAFDLNNYRLGYGKGYYDRYLKKHHIKNIGLFYKEQCVNKLPIDSFDIPLDYIICY